MTRTPLELPSHVSASTRVRFWSRSTTDGVGFGRVARRMGRIAGLLAVLGCVAAPLPSVWAEGLPVTTFVSTPNPSHIGDPVTFTATVVQPTAATGTVTFKEGATELGTATLGASADSSNLSVGGNHNCALSSGGGVECWGSNAWGQLGDGTNTDRRTPAPVSGVSDAIAVASGGNHVCALLRSGSVKCWGYNTFGELGDGTTTERNVPVAVSGLSGAIAIAAGADHTCAVLQDGTVRCWGENSQGQLGDGSTTNRLTPVAVKDLTGASSVSAGGIHTCALTSVGEVWCWGHNVQGQLGDGTTTSSKTPVAVAGLSDATAIAVGNKHSCALTGTGTVMCWGENDYGEIGDGSSTNRSSPVAVSGLGGVVQLKAGSLHNCALLSTGTMKCWGRGFYGELGNGATAIRRVPDDVSGLTGAVAISAGVHHTCALTSAGMMMCWGANWNGEVGDDTTTQRTTPVDAFARPVHIRARLTTAALAIGAHSIVAAYSGDGAYPADQSGFRVQVVTPPASTTVLTSSKSPTVTGETVTLTATVTSASGTPTGTVEFTWPGGSLGTATLSGGVGTLDTAVLPVGDNTITAAYGGDTDHAASSGTVGQTVGRADTTTALGASGSSAVFGQSVTFTATMTAAAPGSGAPAGGTVDFRVDEASAGTGTVSGGSASWSTSGLPLGSHAVVAVFSGDTDYVGSTSLGVTVTIKAPTTTTLVPSSTKTLPGGPVTLTATVTVGAPGTGTAAGSVDFRDGGATIATVGLSGSGSASLTRVLATGTHALTAVYGGSSTLATSTSSGVAVAVDPRVGPEFRINTRTVGSQQMPALATLKSHGFVVAWTSKGQDGAGWGVYGQRYKANGAKDGIEFRVNTTTADDQTAPAVVGTADGGFTVGWIAQTAAAKSLGIRAQRYGASGAKAGGEFRVDTTAGTRQSPPGLAARSAGGFLATWLSNASSGGGFGVKVQLHGPTGTKIGGEVKLGTTAMAVVSTPAAATLTGGTHVVVWASAAKVGANPVIRAQRLSATGAKLGGEIAVTGATWAQSDSVVAATSDGGFVVAWTATGLDGSAKGVHAQRYTATGAKAGATFRVNTTTAGDQCEPGLAARPGGGFTVAWTSNGQDGSGKSVHAQRFSAAGTRIDGELRINTTTANHQWQPSLGIPTATDFVAAWTSLGQDGNLEGVYGQRFAIAP